QSLVSANPQIANPNVIFPGQMICIPTGGPSPGPDCSGGRIYRVVAGDTMYAIANRNGITLDALIRANPQISNPNVIFPGQEICIPTGGGPGVSCPSGTLYTVMPGDTMFAIAQRNNLTLSALIAANPQITDPDRINPGQVICIPAVASIQPPPTVPPVTPPVPIQPPAVMPPVAPPVIPPIAPEPPAVMPPIMPPMPCPPAMPLPTPAPPMPLPTPVPPMPLPTPMPPGQMPIHRPCPPASGELPTMYQPMPVYVVVPWDECPYRPKKKQKHDRKRRCCK
ncbi:MAG TPA: SafA/ExsA family spore coat assembly protein, partial [Bacillota bacterium]|nr:SafA/ExsA family spore coat assembly protein [Bacillota bacterium]